MTSIPADDPTLGLFSVLRDDGASDPESDPFLDEATLLALERDGVIAGRSAAAVAR